MNLLTTISNSLMEGFFPKGWDLAKIDGLGGISGEELLTKKSWWSPGFYPVSCQNLADPGSQRLSGNLANHARVDHSTN